MAKNILKLTDLGLQAANNASAGGILVDLLSFKVGTSRTLPQATDLDIKGAEVHAGSITFIEVLDEHSVRFRFDIPTYVAPEEGVDINEVAVYMPANIMFGRCVLLNTFHIAHKEGISIDCILTTSECDLSVLNVVIGDYVSVPSTPFVYRIPDPSGAEHNSVNVLDLMENTDGTNSAGQVVRFGQGSLHWAFQGHDRIYHNTPDAGPTTSEFGAASLVSTHAIEDNDRVIVQVVTGAGRGECRKFTYNASRSVFVEADGQPFTTFGPNSVISVWRKIGGSMSLTGALPDTNGIPPDWVLHRGPDSDPVWAPINVGGRNINTLYRTPGRLIVSPLSNVGDSQTARYAIPGVAVKNANHVITAIGSVSQHRNAFEIAGNELEYAEAIPAGAPIDIRALTKEPTAGHYTNIVEDAFVSDGNAMRYRVSQAIEGPQYALVYVKGGLQALTSYTYDASAQEIVFTEIIAGGLEIEINTIATEAEEGWSCEPTTTSLYTTGETHFLELPLEPQGIENTFISINGVHLHRIAYSLVGNKIILGSPIPSNRMVEIMVIHNWKSEGTPQTNLGGVVVDATITHKSLNLLRHDAPPIRLPIPGVSIEAGKGMRVDGIHPNYVISSTLAETFNKDSVFNFSSSKTDTDSEELIFTKRIDVKSDMILQVNADFSAVLGPGFESPEGRELIEYVVGFRTTSAKEPEYGRRIKGTGEAGFNSLVAEGDQKAFSNASMCQSYSVIKNNIPAGYIDIVARMRVRHANVSQYGSVLALNFNVVGLPKV